MNWRKKILKEGHDFYINKNIKYKDWPKWLKFRFNMMHFIMDWLSWDAVKSIWKVPRIKFKLWLFYKKYPFLKK